jgi:pimeloyl-ACP methyl ester carboxylesterase
MLCHSAPAALLVPRCALSVALLAVTLGSPATAEDFAIGDVACNLPELHCPDAGCAPELIVRPGNVVEPGSGRAYYLDYPCGLEPGTSVTFILNVHGTAAPANWHRHYFPAHDFKDELGLIVATPQARGDSKETRMAQQWGDDVDLGYVKGVVEDVYSRFAGLSIDRFWLVGHSQGGGYVQRLVCSEGFRERVDGVVALAGGYPGVRGELPDCDFSFILETGSEDSIGNRVSERAPWADRLECGARVREADVVDTKAGYVYDTRDREDPFPGWGGEPGPGTAEVYRYPDCRDGHVLADVIRKDKGHTEGLEPNVTRRILELMLAAGTHVSH